MRRPADRDDGARPRIGRYAAPAALVAAVLAIGLLVSTNHHTAAKTTPAVVARPHSRHHFWIVRSNQTLSEIVDRTGVSLGRIEALNPHLNPGALQMGQRIRIRP
jgi:LysM repeat protein